MKKYKHIFTVSTWPNVGSRISVMIPTKSRNTYFINNENTTHVNINQIPKTQIRNKIITNKHIQTDRGKPYINYPSKRTTPTLKNQRTTNMRHEKAQTNIYKETEEKFTSIIPVNVPLTHWKNKRQRTWDTNRCSLSTQPQSPTMYK